MLIIFIAGGSASGKTELAIKLFERFSLLGIHCLSITLDDYYKEMPDGIDLLRYKQITNFDDPNCLDFSLLKKHILMLQRGECIEKPEFDFKTERRIKVKSISPPMVLLVEGTSSLLFAQQIREDLHHSYRIFIEADLDTLLRRRIKRDRLERGYSDEESILRKDIEYVRPTFLSLIEPSKYFADICIDNNKTNTIFTEQHPLAISAEEIVRRLAILTHFDDEKICELH